MDDHFAAIDEPLIPSREYTRAKAKKKCQVIALIMVVAGIIALGIGLAIPEREYDHGTRLLRATHIVNATHIVPMGIPENFTTVYVLHDDSSAQVMHLADTDATTDAAGASNGSSTDSKDPTQALLRAKYRPAAKPAKLVTRGKFLLRGQEKVDAEKAAADDEEDISLPTVLAYARMASSAYDFDHGTYDGKTGDGAHGDGDGYGHARNDDQTHVKAVVYESGTYSCWWWCKFLPDSKNAGKTATNVVVAFKGTSKIGWTMRSDFLTDADMFVYSIAKNDTISGPAINGPHIKRYWLESEAIVNKIKTVLYPPSSTINLQLSFTGHSLGGVLAGLHAVKNNVVGVGFNSPAGTKVAEILGVDLTGGSGVVGNSTNGTTPHARSSFCTYNMVNDPLSDQSPPDVIPLLMANRGGLDLLFLGSQVTRAVTYLRSGEYTPQSQLGRVAPLHVSPKITDPEELHSIVTIVDLLEALKKQDGAQGNTLRCA